MQRSVTGLVVFAAAAFGVAVIAAQEARPKDVPFYTWVREDTFAGWMNNDPVRHAKGIKRAQDYVDENPANGEAVNWVGAGKIFDATRAFEAGDRAKGDLLFAEGMALMEKGVALAPDDGGVRATTAGTLMNFARKLPDPHYRSAIEKAREHYALLYRMQEAQLDRFPLHLKGEVLAGVAETEFRVGDREKATVFLNRIVAGMPGTAYAQTAEAWLATPESVTRQQRLVCQSCHEPGRLSVWLAKNPSGH